MLASPSLCLAHSGCEQAGDTPRSHNYQLDCSCELVKHAAVSACARPQRRVPDCHIHGHHVRDAEPTRQRRARDHPLLSLRTRDCRSQIGGCRPLAQREFLPCVTMVRVRCDYQTRYSYFYSCTLYCRSTADLTLQISTHRWTPSTSTLKSLSSHRPGGALDRPTGSGDCRSEIFCL